MLQVAGKNAITTPTFYLHCTFEVVFVPFAAHVLLQHPSFCSTCSPVRKVGCQQSLCWAAVSTSSVPAGMTQLSSAFLTLRARLAKKKKKCHYCTECPLWGCLLALKMLFCMGSESMPSTPHSKPLGVRVSLWINPLQPRKSFLPFITSTGVELNTIYTFSLPLSFMMHSPILITLHRSSSNFCLWPRELYWIGISRSVSNTEQHTNCMITFSVSHWTESILITWKTLQWTVLDLRNL